MAHREVQRVAFAGSQGLDLVGRLELPRRPPAAIALFAHCFTCGKDVVAASRISAGLVAEGIAVFRFDFTGLGSSDGDFANTDFSSNVADLVAAAAMLREHYRAPSMLIGHSLGGAAVLAAAGQIPETEAVVTIAAPSDPAHVAGLFGDHALAAIDADGNAPVTLAGREFTIRREFIEDVSEQNLGASIAQLDAALLVMHSPSDQIVSVDHAATIYRAARHPKSFVALDGADHLLTDRADAAYVAAMVATWASRYVPATGDLTGAGGAAVTNGTPVEGQVVVAESGPGAYTQEVSAGTHVFSADEPLGVGDDLGPSPYDLLLASLGTCTSMTLRMYAQRRDLPLEHVRVTLSHERRHCDDCEDPEGRPRAVAFVQRTIELTGELTTAQRHKLAEIADKCPVHRTLTGEVRVETELVDPVPR